MKLFVFTANGVRYEAPTVAEMWCIIYDLRRQGISVDEHSIRIEK